MTKETLIKIIMDQQDLISNLQEKLEEAYDYILVNCDKNSAEDENN